MEPARPLESPAPLPASSSAPQPMRKRPLLAAFLSAFPGMGHIYDGLYLRGTLFFAVAASLLALTDDGNEHSVLGFVVAFVWIFNILDAYRQAQLINFGYAQDLGLEDLPKTPKAGQAGLVAGLLLIGLGTVSALQLFFGIDMGWLLDYWPLGLIGIGIWLVVAGVRERRARAGATEFPSVS